MPQLLAATLELRERAFSGARHVIAARREILEVFRGVQHVAHMFRVVFPVRGEMEFAAGLKLARDEFHELRLHDAALVMPLLWPGIGEVEKHAVETCIGDLSFKNFDGVAAGDAQIGDAGVTGMFQKVSDAGAVDFDADEIPLRMFLREFEERVAVAETDFKHHGCFTAKERGEIQRCVVFRDAELGQPAVERALLPGGEPAFAANEAADAPERLGVTHY